MEGHRLTPRVDYDEVSSTYNRRYERNQYDGIASTLDRFAAGCRRILEVGCGTGHWVQALARPDRVVIGLDPSTGMLQRAPSQLSLVRAGAEAVPFQGASFDLVFVVNAAHHFGSLQAFCEESARVLWRSGRVVVIGLDPNAGTDSWFLYDYFPEARAFDLARYPTRANIASSLEGAGFGEITSGIAQHIRLEEDARSLLESGALDRNATSQLTILDDQVYEDGISRIRAAVEAAERKGGGLKLSASLRLYFTQGVLTD